MSNPAPYQGYTEGDLGRNGSYRKGREWMEAHAQHQDVGKVRAVVGRLRPGGKFFGGDEPPAGERAYVELLQGRDEETARSIVLYDGPLSGEGVACVLKMTVEEKDVVLRALGYAGRLERWGDTLTREALTIQAVAARMIAGGA